MAVLDPSLKENYSLGHHVAAAVENMKALHAMVTALAADVAALRRSLLEEPGFAPQYEGHLKVAVKAAKPLVAEAMEAYDRIIESVGDLEKLRH